MQSLTARIAFAPQALLGTASTTGFHTVYARRSITVPEFQYIENENYHPGIHQRASQQQARPVRISHTMPVEVDFSVHPNSLPVFLIMMGFSVATVNNTTHYTHTCTKADVDAAVYGTALHAMGEDTARFERRIQDIRGTSLQFTASRQGFMGTFTGIGITEVEAAGTETVTAEVADDILPTKGSLTWATYAFGSPRQHVFTISRPVDEEDQKIHTFGLAALGEMGFDLGGDMTGIDMTTAVYADLFGDGTDIGPAEPIVTDDLNFKFESAANIPGAAVPYSIEFDIPLLEVRGQRFGPQDNQILRGNLNWSMIDELATAPVTIVVVNDIASY